MTDQRGSGSPNRLGTEIRRLRKRKGFYLKELADAAGVSRPWLNSVELGTISGLTRGAQEKIVLVAQALEVEPEALLSLTPHDFTMSVPPWDELLALQRETLAELRALRGEGAVLEELESSMAQALDSSARRAVEHAEGRTDDVPGHGEPLVAPSGRRKRRGAD